MPNVLIFLYLKFKISCSIALSMKKVCHLGACITKFSASVLYLQHCFMDLNDSYVTIGNDKNMFVSYSYPRYYCKLNASLFDLHGPSFVSSILYKSGFMDL